MVMVMVMKRAQWYILMSFTEYRLIAT